MENPKTIKEAFLPIEERLLEFETKSYLHPKIGYKLEPYKDRINEVTRLISRFSNYEIFQTAQSLSKRVSSMINKLEFPLYLFEIDVDGKVEEEKLSENMKNHIKNDWYNELNSYLLYLKVLEENNVNSESDVVTVDDQLKVDEKKITILCNYGQFDSGMSAKEGALLIHYFIESNLSPIKSNATKGKICKALFNLDKDNVRTTYSDKGFPHYKKDLIKLMDKLNEMIVLVDRDLKEAEKYSKEK